MRSFKNALMCLAVLLAFLLVACTSKKTKTPGLEEAIGIAVDAYVYGYPLVTFDTRKQQTNVAKPDAEHAPWGR